MTAFRPLGSGPLAGGARTPPAQTLSPPLVSDGDTIFTPIIDVEGDCITYEGENVVYDGECLSYGDLALYPPLVADGDTVYAPTLTVGAVTLSPPLVNSIAVPFAPLVTLGDVVVIQPSLLAETDTVYPPTITTGAVTLSPPRIEDGDTVFAPTVLPSFPQTLSPPLVQDGDTVFAPRITRQGDAIDLGGTGGGGGLGRAYSGGAGRRRLGDSRRDLDEIRDALERAYRKSTQRLKKAVKADDAVALLPEVKAAQRAAAAIAGGLPFGQSWPLLQAIDWDRVFADAEMFNFLFDQLRQATLAAQQNAVIRLAQELEQARLETEAANRLLAEYQVARAEEETLILLMAA